MTGLDAASPAPAPPPPIDAAGFFVTGKWWAHVYRCTDCRHAWECESANRCERSSCGQCGRRNRPVASDDMSEEAWQAVGCWP